MLSAMREMGKGIYLNKHKIDDSQYNIKNYLKNPNFVI